jgi:glycosidase
MPSMTSTPTPFAHVPWSHQASIYEVNVRQYTPEGTLSAFEAHLPRLAAMGVGILWFMPIQPIGILNRKGGLGSYYSIRDYTAVNPEFGTLADFRRVVARAHALGMKVILDWVANHTAWDHPWVTGHPDWYRKDARGEIHAYTYLATPEAEPEYWTDVVGLDYRAPDLWPAMTEAMRFWLQEADIDGFRCDVASLVPTPFWEQARVALEAIKPVFMLAESDAVDLHAKAFDMTYDWRLYDALKLVAKGQAGAADIRAWWAREQATYPPDAYRMRYTANHDSNSWHGHDAEFYGPAFEAMAVLAATLPGMALVYSGQEAGLDRQLAFFEKDLIDWRDLPRAAFYTHLLQLKQHHSALGNGREGGTLEWLDSADPAVLGYRRQRGDDRVTITVHLGTSTKDSAGQAGPAWGWRIETT